MISREPTAPNTEIKTRPSPGNGWLRNLRAGARRLRRQGVSLRTELIVLLVALVLLATAGFGSIAYQTARNIVEGAAEREVGITARVRTQMLLAVLNQQQVRANALLKTADVGCSRDETGCQRRLLADFVATEGATDARLAYTGYNPALSSPDARALPAFQFPVDSQIVHFDFDKSGQPFYVLQARLDDGVLTIRGDMDVFNEIFGDRTGLGESGESFLTNREGFFLTPPKHPPQTGGGRAIAGEPLQTCLSGKEGNVQAIGYNGAPVIYGYKYVEQIGGGCIMALIDQAEAFAPAKTIETKIAGVSALLALLAILSSLLIAQLVSRPMKRLTRRAQSLENGDFDSPVPLGGPSEVRMFAHTFEAMAQSLKASRAALQESSQQITNIVESVGDGFAAFDRQWRCTYVNDKAIELCRVPRADLLGKNVWELFPQTQNTTAYPALCHAMEERSTLHFEEHYELLDMWLEIDAYPIRDGLAVLGRDVTERKRFMQQLQQTQKLESLGVLAGGIAHDFNNLLTGIMGNASLALDALPYSSPLRRNLGVVVKSAEHAAALTRQLLAYAGKGRFVIEPFSLSDLVREITNLLRTSVPRNVHLQTELHDYLPPVEGDVAQIQQLIMNLVMNAAEASPEGVAATVVITTGEVHLNLADDEPMLTSAGILPGRYVMLAVRDEGCGMDDSTQTRIFDPFFTTKFAGRGLGLAAVMGIVRGHKGGLQVESSPGKGSCFRVLFPAHEEQSVKRDLPLREQDLAGHGIILVIDDEDAVQQTAKSALESYGYYVLVAPNGEEGVRLFQEKSNWIDAVLLDVTMPVMSGEETLVRLKKIRPEIPVVLSSGYSETEVNQRFAGKGLASFIQKPYTASSLGERMKAVLKASAHTHLRPA